jgi:hypothetical protein
VCGQRSTGNNNITNGRSAYATTIYSGNNTRSSHTSINISISDKSTCKISSGNNAIIGRKSSSWGNNKGNNDITTTTDEEEEEEEGSTDTDDDMTFSPEEEREMEHILERQSKRA